MSSLFRYIVIAFTVCTLLSSSLAFGVSRTQKGSAASKAKSADTVKQAAPKPAAESKTLAPASKDTSSKGKVAAPAKLNDFQDKNKNGVDDRLEKPKSSTIKKSPVSTDQKSKSKSTESKKSSSSKTSSKKSK